MKNTLMSYLLAAAIFISPAVLSGCFGTGDNADTVPPEITSMVPGNAEEDVAINANITVVFSKPVINISNTTFTIERVGSFGSVPATVSYNDATRTATLNPAEDLDWDTIYVVNITSDVRSRAGVALPAASWVFTTGQEADSIPPAVASKSPTLTHYVPVDGAIYVFFSERVNNVNETTFYIKKNGAGSPLAATVSYNVDTNKATLNAGTLEEWTSYTIYLADTITDIAGNSLSEAPWTFMTNDLTAPQVISRNPQNGDTVPTNAAVSVVFSEPIAEGTFNNADNFKLVRVSPEMTVSAVLTYNDSTKTATLIPSTLLEEGVSYRVELSSGIRDRAYNQLFNPTGSWIFTTTAVVDTTPPTVVSTDPVNGDINQSTTDPVTVLFSENVTGVNTSSFILERASDSQQVSGSVIYTAGTRTATFTPLVALTQGVTYRARLAATIKDVANNTLDAVSWIYTTADTTKPSVSSISPASEAGNVAPNSNISVTFSENVSGVSDMSFTVVNDGTGLPVSGDVSYVPATKTAVFDPDATLPFASQFTVTLTSAIKDPSNNTLNTYSWKFYTGIEPDTTPPTVVSPTYPDHTTHETNIPVESMVSVYFSEPVTGVGASNVTLREGDEYGAQVASLVSYDAVAKKATIMPTVNLKFGTQYTVVVKGGASTEIRDAADNKVASDIIWSFDTRADTTKPTVTYRYPEQGTIGVPGNAVSVNVIFSEQVVESSVENSNNFILEKVGGSAVPCNISYTYDPATGTSSATLSPVSTIEEAVAADYRVRLTSGIIDMAKVPNTLIEESWTFQICGKDTTPPSVTISNPPDGSVNWTSKKVSATFSEQVTGVSGSTFYLKDSKDNTIPAVVTYYLEYQTAELVVTGSLSNDATYTAHLTGAAIRDRANNPMASDKQWSFATPSDTVPPTVTSVWPPNGTTNYPVDGSVTATFSEAIKNGNDSTFYLTPAATAIVMYDPDNKKLTLTPSGALQGEKTYTVTIKGGVGGITDDAKIPNNLAGDYTWSFTTMSVPDKTAPTIVGGTRYPTGSGVALTTTVSLQFSEHVLNYNKISLKRSGETVELKSIGYDDKTFIVTLTPKEQLIESSTYTVTVPGNSDTGIMDPSFNKLAPTDTWTFVTVADSIRPDIEGAVYPANGTSGIPLKPAITVKFTEPVLNVSKSSFYITGTNVPTLYVIYDADERTATLTPGDNLTNGATYTVNLTNAIIDRALSQNKLVGTDSGNRTWSFTVSTLPVIEKIETYYGTTWTTRADAATVEYDISKMRISFNRLMDESKEWFELYEGTSGTNNPSPATPNGYSWETVSGKSVITYNIVGRFKGNTQYQARLYGWGGTFKDIPDNNEMNKGTYVGDGIFNFTTAPDTTAPEIASTFPVNGATNIVRNTPFIIIRFNEPMNTARDSRVVLSGALVLNLQVSSNGTWFEGGRSLRMSIPGANLPLPTGTITATLSTSTTSERIFKDIAGNNATGSFSFTVGSTLDPTSVATEGFNDANLWPDFTIFTNGGDDDGQWQNYANNTIKSGNGTYITTQDSSAYYVRAASWEWEVEDYADIVLQSAADLGGAGSYIMSFDMFHERLFNAADRLEVYASHDGTYSTTPLASLQRYDWSLGSDSPAYQVHYINLSDYANDSSVFLRFRGVSAGERGGNVIIDNVKITRY